MSRPATATSEPAWAVPWLVVTVVSIVVMIVLGGVVRLAHAGLSIVEWQPISGILPPLTASAWEAAFAAYQETPEYRMINTGMPLEAFRSIYWLEYLHRVAGRLVGLIYVVPLAIGLVGRRFDPRTRNLLLGIGVLFALQGVMGWLMVASGLVHQPWVSPYRLALHLWLAFGLLGWVLWLLLDRTTPDVQLEVAVGLRRSALLLLALVVLQAGAGALVAGHRAGLVSDTFPRMHGEWIPAAIGDTGAGLGDLFSNPVTVHFQHRWFAFVVLAVALWVHARARRLGTGGTARRLAAAAAVLAVVQIGLGIVVVIASVPTSLASMHQGLGVLLFGAAVGLVHQSQP